MPVSSWLALKPPITVRIPSTPGSANAACRSARRAVAGEEEKSSQSPTCSPKEIFRPSAASFRSASARVSDPMIASDLDGAITRTEEPGRSFGGTTGIRPSCRIRTGQASEFVRSPESAVRHGLAATVGRCGSRRGT
jgi:hypothetical protein